MLRKERLRVSRSGGEYQPTFVGSDPDARRLAARLLGVYQGHVGEPRRALTAAVEAIERETGDSGEGLLAAPDAYKLVRGLADLLDREATFETRAPIPPARARRAAFAAAERIGVTDAESRERALAVAAESLGTEPDAVDRSLYADRDPEQVLAAFDARWDPEALCRQYDLSLAATALFDATEVRVRCSDPKRLVSVAKRHGLLYEIRLGDATDDGVREAPLHVDSRTTETDESTTSGATDEQTTETDESTTSSAADGRTADSDASTGSDAADPAAGDPTLSDREVVLTGPDALFRRTRRYGTSFAAVLRSLARGVARWELRATIDDRGTERIMRLTDADVPVPGTEPVAEPGFDSGVERDFARRFRALDLDWTLRREPEPLRTTVDGQRRAMIPDFAVEYDHADFRVYVEVMGFWTPAYVEKKLAQLAGVENVELLVAVDESLGVGEAVEARDHRVVEYDGTVRVKSVVDALRPYETELAGRAAGELPAEIRPPADVTTLDRVADDHGVPTDAVRDAAFPDHERLGGLLVRPHVLDRVCDALEPGLSYEEAETVLADHDLSDASTVLDALGYRVEWTGLGGGTLKRDERSEG